MKPLIRTFPLLLAALLSVSPQSGSAAEDPFAPGPVNLERDGPKFISVCFETFSVELAEATALHRSQPDDVALYKELAIRATKGSAKRESFAILRARSGNKASLKAASEFIYPVSYLPAASQPRPVGFKTQNVGFTLEIEPIIGGNDRIIDLNIMPVFVTMADSSKWGATEAPVFETQSVFSANTLLNNQPQLLSTLSRPPVSKVDADSAKRVWFAFVTAKIVAVYATE
ncbi:MAG: hypothetical protein EOP83_05500 [Verrucomicrobiaceae bacterium]|nr:MAG: hypothetical protein EOP83_05500 [Verrucomicrobiaceae bacterium]